MKEKKDNKCGPYFRCNEKVDECIHRQKTGTKHCMFRLYRHTEMLCNSNEAQTAVMISALEMKGCKVVKDD
jgi:hypothetical protein